MPFFSALDLIQANQSDQTDNLSVVYAVTGLVADIADTVGQTSVLDTIDRLKLYEGSVSINLEALQVPRRTIKFGS